MAGKALCILIAALGCLDTACAERAVVAEAGQARMPIVLAENATERQHELADELGGILQQISGAEFEIVTGNGSGGLVLGTLEQFPMPEWQEALEVRGHDAREAYGVRSEPDRLLVIGATDLGLDRGITKLLEALGCRWFFPNPAWHIIPHSDTLAVDLDLIDRPALLSRVIWWGWGHWDQQAREEHQEWLRRNWMGESLKVYCSHAWQRIIAENKAVFEAHPEYLALRKTTDEATGETAEERGGNKFCVSNSELVALCKRYALDYFAQNPDADMVSMEPSDGGGHCECDPCLAMGPVPERVHYLTNEVAKAVREEYPGKYVGTYAYSFHSEPPSFRMEPNVYVQITAGFTRGRYSFLELIEEWARHVDQLGIYEYLNVWAWWRDIPGRSRGADLAYLQERIPYYIDHGATTMSCESGSNYGINGLGYVVASRLMWNPEADVEAICADFYDKAFGPAAAAMRRYYERFDTGARPLLSDHLLALAHQDVAEASRLAADRPDILARLDDVKLYLYYVRLMRDLEVSGKGEPRLKALFPLLNFAYRTRHRYIVNSPAIRGRYATYYLRDTEQPPEWDYQKMGAKTAWYTGEDYTHEEVQALLQEGLARFRPQQFEEREFSENLVYGHFEPAPGGGAARLCFQNGEAFIMQSLTGEPLEFRLLTGYIAHYRDRRPTEWKVLDGNGNEVSSGELPLDGEWRSISVEVPAAGTYHFSIDDFGAGWQIDYEPGKPYVWALEKGNRAYSLGNLGAVHFYVPEGTREIAYYVEGSAHTVIDGAGETVAEVDRQPGNVIVLPVSEGQDGQVWCLKSLSRTQLWFYNCPNYLAAHAEDMLVPRELVPH
jgi:hypothetical protein